MRIAISPRVPATLAWSLGTLCAAAAGGWLVGQILRPLGVDTDAVVVLTTVTLALLCLLGCRMGALRLGTAGIDENAVMLVGPSLLALSRFVSSQPWWYDVVAAAGILLAAASGLVIAHNVRAHPLDASPYGRGGRA